MLFLLPFFIPRGKTPLHRGVLNPVMLCLRCAGTLGRHTCATDGHVVTFWFFFPHVNVAEVTGPLLVCGALRNVRSVRIGWTGTVLKWTKKCLFHFYYYALWCQSMCKLWSVGFPSVILAILLSKCSFYVTTPHGYYCFTITYPGCNGRSRSWRFRGCTNCTIKCAHQRLKQNNIVFLFAYLFIHSFLKI